MNETVQLILVLLIVAACVAYVGWQFIRTMSSARGKLGACCTKGCGGHDESGHASSEPVPKREQFIGSDTLRSAIKARQSR